MKSGIYKLVFSNNQVYVGQSQDTETRHRQHLSARGKGSPRLQQAFHLYGDPQFELLETTTDLDNREKYWIEQLNPQLNVLPGGEAMRGLNHPRCSYTAAQIKEVVRLYTTTTLKVSEISDLTEVKQGTCHDVLKKRSHLWATEGITIHDRDRPTLYRIYSPSGEEYTAHDLKELESKTGVPYATLNSIIKGVTGTGLNGWSTTKPVVVLLQHGNDEAITTTIPLAKEILKRAGLSPYCVTQLTKRFKPSYGWKITKI